ncbi:hypothetical protein NE609_16660, partial [Anaerotruncus sp. DFI.9.16]|nr:hypothetical protein [Anaerotruncus sp. DFI.9.16]
MPLPIVKPPLPPNLLGQRNENIDTIIFQTAAPVNLILPLGGKFAVFLQDEPSGHADFGGSSQWICRTGSGGGFSRVFRAAPGGAFFAPLRGTPDVPLSAAEIAGTRPGRRADFLR